MSDKNTKMLKVLHCADIHLDSPFSGLDIERSEIRQNELRGTFTSMMLYAKTQKADLVLIAGDLFESGFASKKTVSIITEQFAKMPECKFVISPGNHDPYLEGSVYDTCTFPENVYIFDSEELSCFTFEDIGVDVYGWAFTSASLMHSPLANKRADDTGRLKLLCAHCDITSPISKYGPVTVKDIAEFGLDYAALGQVHRTDGIEKIGETYYGYSGCPEGRSFDEPGIGGAYFLTVKRDSEADNADFDINRVKFSRRRYETEQIDITGTADLNEVEKKLVKRISERKYGADTILRVQFTGTVSPDLSRIESLKNDLHGLFMLEVEDKTLPLFDDVHLSEDMTVRGELYRYLLPILKEGDVREREVASMALKYGLAALERLNITDF